MEIPGLESFFSKLWEDDGAAKVLSRYVRQASQLHLFLDAGTVNAAVQEGVEEAKLRRFLEEGIPSLDRAITLEEGISQAHVPDILYHNPCLAQVPEKNLFAYLANLSKLFDLFGEIKRCYKRVGAGIGWFLKANPGQQNGIEDNPGFWKEASGQFYHDKNALFPTISPRQSAYRKLFKDVGN